MFVHCGISGFVYDFVPYGGEDTLRKLAFTDEEKQNFGFCNQVVISLSKTVTNPAYSVLYYDNYFSSPDLMHYLRDKKGMLALGTLRSNRSRQYEIKSDKELRQQGRGSFCQKIDNINKVTIVKWYDNKSVLMCSSYCDAYPLSTIKKVYKVWNQRRRKNCNYMSKSDKISCWNAHSIVQISFKNSSLVYEHF